MDLYLYYRIYPSASKGVFTEDGGENVAFLLQFRLLYYLGKTQHASFVTYERENEAKILIQVLYFLLVIFPFKYKIKQSQHCFSGIFLPLSRFTIWDSVKSSLSAVDGCM